MNSQMQFDESMIFNQFSKDEFDLPIAHVTPNTEEISNEVVVTNN